MDRIYNNEALLAVVLLRLLEYGAMGFGRLLLLSAILLDDISRGRLCKAVDAEDFMLKMRNTSKSFNRKYREMTIIFMNAIQLLIQAKRIRYSAHESLEAIQSASDKSIAEIQSDRMQRILSSVEIMHAKLGNIPTDSLYHQLKIQL